MNNLPEKIIPAQELQLCAICARGFTPDRISGHEQICRNSLGASQNSFSISQQIIRSIEMENFPKGGVQESVFNKAHKSMVLLKVFSRKMTISSGIPNLKEFILQRRVLKLYKDFFRLTKEIPNEANRKEIQDWIRRDFKEKKNEKDVYAIKLFIHSGERSLKKLHNSINLCK